MYRKLSIVTIGFAIFAAAACANDNNTGDNIGLGGASGGVAGDMALAGTGGVIGNGEQAATVAGSGGVVAGSGGVVAGSGGVVAGSGGVVAGSGGVVAGSGGVVAGSGGGVAGSGGVVAGSGGIVAGSGGVVAGSGGVDGGEVSGTGGTGTETKIRPPCLQDPSQVALLGDSYMSAPSFVGQAIVNAAIADGALQPGQSYADYSVPGTLMLNGQIPGQLDQALRTNPNLKTYITDGCGNDIIGSIVCLADGSSQNPTCLDIVANCIQAFKDMGTKAAAAGVTDGIIFQYPDNVPLGGAEIMRYGIQEAIKATAEYSTDEFRAYVVDVIPLMKDHPTWYVDALIHVDAQGAKLIGDEIYRVMKENCIAQPESSGCCEPW